jgi:hypothetical protein
MKIWLPVSVALAVVLTGCGGSSNETPPATTNAATSGGSLVDAPTDYLKSAANAKHSADKSIDLTALNKALELFNVQEGRFPKDLDELVAKKYIPVLPPLPAGMKFEYDAKNGTAKLSPQP